MKIKEMDKSMFEDLSAPFEPDKIKWKINAISKDKSKCQMAPYYDVRTVIDRLDEVVGAGNWRCLQSPMPDGLGVMTTIGILIDGIWVDKSDVGFIKFRENNDGSIGKNDHAKIKGAPSDGIKRAAKLWGIGRPYDFINPSSLWVAYNAADKSNVGLPNLPHYCTPKPVTRPYPPKALKDAIGKQAGYLKKDAPVATKSEVGALMGMMKLALETDEARKAVLASLFSVDSGSKLTGAQVKAGLMWADIKKNEEGKSVPSDLFVTEIKNYYESIKEVETNE